MNWKTEATEKLRRYEAMRQALHNIPEELARLDAQIHSPRAVRTDSISVRGGAGPEDALLNSIVCRQELRWSLEQAQSWVRTTERALSVLLPEEKLILQQLYISPRADALSWLCSRLQLEQSSIYRRRDKALRSFTIALYGAEGS